MQLLTSKFKTTDQFTTWSIRLLMAARRLHPRKKETFTDQDFFDIAELNNILFYQTKVMQDEFTVFMRNMAEKRKVNGRFTASPTQAAIMLAWVEAFIAEIGEMTWAEFTRAQQNHERHHARTAVGINGTKKKTAKKRY